ncbi:MAG: glutathione S-transferase family protein [Alphaproteobacteria bacterium]|nr:MAG: glutathione S-transferase family protein [Alphaproteobacteria bacterium]
MYTVIGNRRSRTLRVLWLLEELGAPYEHMPAAPQSEAVRAHYPAGKVPVMLVEGEALTDSTAIMQYLADRHGAFTFPAGTLQRARQDGHTHFLLDEFDALLWTAARHSFVLPEDWRLPDVKDSLKWEFETSVERFLGRLGEGPFLMGEQMTVPDIIAAHCGSWAKAAKFPLENPAFEAYLARMFARPAYRRALGK